MTGPELGRLGQITFLVQDLARATAFWRDVLGIPFLFAAPGLAFFDCGGVRVMLTRPEPGQPDRNGALLYFRVDDIAAAHAALAARGVRFDGPPHIVHRAADHDLWLAAFRDSEDNQLVLMSEVRRPG
jgi:methylmalonyl-CoA/ethylmalonyl-CoA epimerase